MAKRRTLSDSEKADLRERRKFLEQQRLEAKRLQMTLDEILAQVPEKNPQKRLFD